MGQTISIIIPTKGRCESLLRAVRSIANQTATPNELIIVDQTPGTSEAREEVLKICAAEIRVKYIWNPEIPGGAVARNVAMEETSGDITLFLDDDVTLHPDFIERLLSSWREHPEATGISGVPDNYSPPGAFYYGWSKIFMRGRFHDDRQPVYWRAAGIQTPVRVTRLSGGMMSFRRCATDGKQFDPNLRGVSDAEDVDFCMRLGSEALLFIDPRCKLTHHLDPSGREKDHWLRRHARAYTYLYLRNWRTQKLSYAWLWCGWILAAILGCTSRRSVYPLRLLASGYREGRSMLMTKRAVGSHGWLKILHVEVGGSYGGSLGALEVYLAHSKRDELIHDLLFYYPTPNAEKLLPHVGKLSTLYSAVPAWLREGSRSEHARNRRLRRLARLRGVAALRSWAAVIKQLPTAIRLTRVIRRGNYDVIHVNNTLTYQIPTLLAARLAGVPVIAHVRNPVAEGAGVSLFARRAKCLVSVAEVHSENLRKMDGSLRVITCHDAVERVSVNGPSAQVLRRSLVNDGEVLVGCLGRLDPQKGFEFLIRAAAIVVAEVPNVRFAIAGEGTLRKDLEGLINSFGLQNHFRLIGFRTDFADFLAALDIYAISSLWEGLPLSLLEAMQLGKPAVATAVGGIPEVIRDHVNGLLVPARDSGKLAAAILELIRDPELGSRLGSAGPRTAEPFCDLEARARELDSIFLTAVRPSSEN